MSPRAVKVEAEALRLDPEAAVRPFEWPGIFDAVGPVEIEVGIGKGRFLLAAAEKRPEVLHLGVEWANKYLRMAERRSVRRGLENIRFARIDAREMVHQAVPDASVTAYYVFYPDPWPKKRHHKRRFFRPDTVDHLARTLIEGGHVHAATDHAEYWEVIEPLLDGHPCFARIPEFGGDVFPLPTEEPLTNFEAKYRIEGRNRHRGSWQRNGDPSPVERTPVGDAG